MVRRVKSLAALLGGIVLVVVAISCSHPIVIVGNGDVTSASGERDCYLEEFLANEDNCSKNYAIHDYTETYYAVPREGWQFDRWVNYCTNVKTNQCSFNVPAETVHQFWGGTAASLQAEFRKIDNPDTVIVDGKEWLQPDLFLGFTWDQVNAVCPEGECLGALPGSAINLTGYNWASVEDLNALFNHYVGSDVLGPGPDCYGEGHDNPWVDAFFDDGWRDHNFFPGYVSVGGRLRDSADYIAFLVDSWTPGMGSGGDGICTNETFTGVNDPGTGAWFYRTP